jgi:steroid 5-alpha reductase family enzyme
VKKYLYPILFWFGLAIIAILNGTLRQAGYGPFVGELLAHQISCFVGISLFFIAMYVFFKYAKIDYTKKELLVIGIAWLLMAILFEFVFGHYVMGNSWEKLFADYNLLQGRLWVLVLLATAAGPLLVYSRARR